MEVPAPVSELYVGDGYSVLVAEDRQPRVVISAEFIKSLAPVLRAAHARALALSPGQDVEAVRVLCDSLLPVLKNYERAVREWVASRPLPNGMQPALSELDKIRKMLDDDSD
jgi:hypothetical protein